MKIVYGLAGEGFGHAARSKIIINHLKKQGFIVKVITYGKAYQMLSAYKPIKISGLHLYSKNDKISTFRTIKNNIPNVYKAIEDWPSLISKIRKFNPDLIITDFEPITARIAYKLKKPLISIDNQQLLTKVKHKVPLKYLASYYPAKIVTKLFVPRANHYLIISPSNYTSKKDYTVIPPLRDFDLKKLKNFYGRHILVYLSKNNSSLIENLRNTKENYIIYSENPPKKEDNITFKSFGPEFKVDLASSKAVIGSAGLSLITECLILNKPILAIPIKNHFEQWLNTLQITKKNIGLSSQSPDIETINSFLDNINKFQKNFKKIKSAKNDGLNTILKKVEEVHSLSKSLQIKT